MNRFSLFGPDLADEIISRRKNRSVMAESGGEFYATRTILDTNDAVKAELLAQDYMSIADLTKEGFKGVLLRRKQNKLAKSLIAIAHREVEGNLDLYALDVESGLLEPGINDRSVGRLMLADNLARDILTGNIEVPSAAQ